MRVLVACEESQAVTKEFRALGHEAYSCDIIDQSGGHPEWHIMQDVLPLLNGNCTFRTTDGLDHTICGRWDMIIAFPPCTHLAVSGARHFKKKRESGIQLEAIWFFSRLLLADCDRVAIENPVNIIGGDYIKKHFPQFSYMPNFSQKIQPYQFGDPVRKATCLWNWIKNKTQSLMQSMEVRYNSGTVTPPKSGIESFPYVAWSTRTCLKFTYNGKCNN